MKILDQNTTSGLSAFKLVPELVPPVGLEQGLVIADGVSLPLDAVTEVIGVFGKRGMGKSNTARVLAEGMLRAGQQVIIFDPLDVWWGLALDAAGTAPGESVLVFGGSHGHLPLSPVAGDLVARVLVETGRSAVLSLSGMRRAEAALFVADFAEGLLRAKDARRSPLHLVWDEAQRFVPQSQVKGQERMQLAVEDLVLGGRVFGLGHTLISQRLALVSKDVTTQAGAIAAHGSAAPQDRAAIAGWLDAHATPEERAEVLGSLGRLAVGEVWLLSAGWLRVVRRVRVRLASTFDSSATPKVGAAPVQPPALDAAGLDEIRRMLADGEKEFFSDGAESGDGEEAMDELRRENSRLRADIRADILVPQSEAERLRSLLQVRDAKIVALEALLSSDKKILKKILKPAPDKKTRSAPQKNPPTAANRTFAPALPDKPDKPDNPVPSSQVVPREKDGRRLIAGVLAKCRPYWLMPAQVRTLAGLALSDAEMENHLRALLRAGHLQRDRALIRATAAGAGDGPDPKKNPMTLEGWRALWVPALPKAAARFLEALEVAGPDGLTWPELLDRAGYTDNGRIFKARGLLLENGLIEKVGPGGRLLRVAAAWSAPPGSSSGDAAPALRLHVHDGKG